MHLPGGRSGTADSSEVSELTQVSTYLKEWVLATRSRYTAATARAYVGDVATVLEKSGVRLEGEPPEVPTVSGQAAVPETVWRRAWLAGQAVTVAELTPAWLARHLDMAGAGKSPATQRRMYSAMSSLCAHLYRYAVLPDNPMTHPSLDRPRLPHDLPHPLPDTQLQAVFSVVTTPDPQARQPWPARDFALAATLIGTGLRVGEAAGIQVGEWVVTPGQLSTLRVRGKGRKVRVIPTSPEVDSAVTAYLEQRQELLGPTQPKDCLFVRRDGTGFSPDSIRRLVRRWYQRAGVSGVDGAPVHSWRASFATLAVADGTALPVVQSLLGHASLTTTQRYVGVADIDVAHAIMSHRSRTLLQ